MDADMIAYEGLTAHVVDMTVSGKWAFAPIVWSTDGKAEDWYAGAWRAHGTGMIAFFVSGESEWVLVQHPGATHLEAKRLLAPGCHNLC